MNQKTSFLLALPFVLSCTPVYPLARLNEWWIYEERGFSMRLPPEVRGGPVQGIDSSVGEFESRYLKLSYDYGMWSCPTEGARNAAESHEEKWMINGEAAAVLSWRFPAYSKEFSRFLMVHFPNAGPAGGKLSVFAWFDEEAHAATVKEIFQSIEFSPQKHRRR